MIDKLKKKELCRERYHHLVAGYIYTLYVNQDTFVILYTAFPKIGAASLIQYAKNKNKKTHTKHLLLEYFSPTVPRLSSK